MNLLATPYREFADSLNQIAAEIRNNRDLKIRLFEEDHRLDYQKKLIMWVIKTKTPAGRSRY